MNSEQLAEALHALIEKFSKGRDDSHEAGYDFAEVLLDVASSPRLEDGFGLGFHDGIGL